MFYDDIYHYGIPGQRHGRRRFQNRDGSLTPAGRIRYGRGDKGRSTGSFMDPHTSSNAHSVRYGKIADIASNYASNYGPKGYSGDRRSDSIQTKTRDMRRRQYEQSGQKGREESIGNYLSTSKRRAANDLLISAVTTGKNNQAMQRIKRPSNSNKNGTTSGSTKQNRGLSKNTQERTRYLTERAAAMNAIDLNAKYTRRLFAGLDTEDIKTNGTANNARNRYLDGLDALATRLGLTTDDLVISNFPSYEASYNSSSKRR